MIEMIGILALIGILSVVSVYVFQKAMTKNRTNQLLEDMRLAGLVVLDGLYDKLTENEIPIKVQFEQQTPYTFTAALEEDNLNTFVIVADGVPFDVCTSVKDKNPNWAEAVAVNGVEETCHETENNFVSFFFNDELTDLIHDYCENNSDCGECGQCKNRRCKYGYKNRSGKCFSCDDTSEQVLDVDEEECTRCKNRMYSSYNGGRCLNCDTPNMNYWNSVSYEECMKCPNHRSLVAPGETGQCWGCNGNIDPVTGLCDTIKCDQKDSVIYGNTAEQCNLCANRFYDAFGRCAKCSTSSSRKLNEASFDECLKCPNQASSASPGESGYCFYCPGTVDPTTGKCSTIECDSEDIQIGGVTAEQCSQCNNRFYSLRAGGRCIKCMTSTEDRGFTPFDECLRCPHQSSDVGPGKIGTCRYCAGTVNKTTGKCE